LRQVESRSASPARTVFGPGNDELNRFSLREKEWTELVLRNVAAGLPENRVACAGIELAVIRHDKRLLFTLTAGSAQLDVAAALCQNNKTEMLKRGNYL
jgi:hypothetical protein